MPQSLVDQLAPGGRLVIPVGGRINQSLLRITRAADGELIQEELEMVSFVTIVGEEGW